MSLTASQQNMLTRLNKTTSQLMNDNIATAEDLFLSLVVYDYGYEDFIISDAAFYGKRENVFEEQTFKKLEQNMIKNKPKKMKKDVIKAFFIEIANYNYVFVRQDEVDANIYFKDKVFDIGTEQFRDYVTTDVYTAMLGVNTTSRSYAPDNNTPFYTAVPEKLQEIEQMLQTDFPDEDIRNFFLEYCKCALYKKQSFFFLSRPSQCHELFMEMIFPYTTEDRGNRKIDPLYRYVIQTTDKLVYKPIREKLAVTKVSGKYLPSSLGVYDFQYYRKKPREDDNLYISLFHKIINS